MKLISGYRKIKDLSHKPFGEILEDYCIDDININKGLTGTILEQLIGLRNTNNITDFIDGELKTNKVDITGKAIETLSICKLSNEVEPIVNGQEFKDSRLYHKLKKVLYVPVVKDDVNPLNWYFLNPKITNLNKNKKLEKLIEQDYNYICSCIKTNISQGYMIEPCQGQYLQIRTKDSKPYNPISLGNMIYSDKNYAFYAKRKLIDLLSNY